ncbi:MAG: PspC domain-containing protein [Patescibacteria group bacterium]
MKTYNKRLYKSNDNKVISGVMGGLGEYFDIDPVVFRVAYTAFSFFTGIVPGMLTYIFMALVMPKRPEVVVEKSEVK